MRCAFNKCPLISHIMSLFNCPHAKILFKQLIADRRLTVSIMS